MVVNWIQNPSEHKITMHIFTTYCVIVKLLFDDNESKVTRYHQTTEKKLYTYLYIHMFQSVCSAMFL